MVGAIIRQGPHHAAQQSTSTGRSPAFRKTSPIVASETSTGSEAIPPKFNVAPHFPHTGVFVCATASSTRFFAPHFAHATITMTIS
jgi:hypothetical protein